MTNETEHKRAALVYMLGSWPTVILLCDSRRPDVVVPEKYRQAQLPLRLGYQTQPPTPDLQVTERGVTCTLAFGGVPHHVSVPWEAVYLITPDGDDRAAVWPGSFPADVKFGGPVEVKDPKPSPGHLKLVE